MKLYSREGNQYSEESACYSSLIFPGGEAHVAITGHDYFQQIAVVENGSSDELMLLAMWADACRREQRHSTAVIPYLPGARQDRGVPLGAKVYADFINSMKIDRVVCFDPHSDVMPALLERTIVVPLERLPFWEFNVNGVDGTLKFDGVVCPDLGARKRAENVAAVLDVPVYQGMKHRDFKTGQLSKFTCEPLPHGSNLIVVDDICDGGGTFVGLAAAIKDFVSLSLWVSHGIFSKGVDELLRHYNDIFTTDSHSGHLPVSASVQTVPLLPFLLSEADKVT